jgi:hypothetical protein
MENQTYELEPRAFNSQERLYHDTTTWLAEVLDGNMRTEFEYSFDGQELYASDGSAMGGLFEESIIDARRLAEENPKLDFEIARRQTELDEYQDMLKMAGGELPSTMVVVSDFPEELKNSSKDEGGYNHQRQQTMLRIINCTQDGGIKVTSQSLDRSDRAGLEAIYHFFGLQPKTGELLGQRIYADIEPDRQELLADELTREYDRTLEQKYGGQYYAGRAPVERDNTYDFVLAQQDLIDFYMAEPNEKNKLGLVATVESRFKKGKKTGIQAESRGETQPINTSQIHLEIEIAVQRAVQQNRVYSGCGMTINMSDGADGLAKTQLEKLGYGNKSKEFSESTNKEMKCVNCPKCRTFHESLKPTKGEYKCKNKNCGHTAKA